MKVESAMTKVVIGNKEGRAVCGGCGGGWWFMKNPQINVSANLLTVPAMMLKNQRERDKIYKFR